MLRQLTAASCAEASRQRGEIRLSPGRARTFFRTNVQVRVVKKCPAAGFFGVAQSPKSSRGGTFGMIQAAEPIASEFLVFSKHVKPFRFICLLQQGSLASQDEPAYSLQASRPAAGIRIA
jgi:hypothetical protein